MLPDSPKGFMSRIILCSYGRKNCALELKTHPLIDFSTKVEEYKMYTYTLCFII